VQEPRKSGAKTTQKLRAVHCCCSMQKSMRKASLGFKQQQDVSVNCAHLHN
jgi:hypothetical protein